MNSTAQDKLKGVLLPSYTPRWLPLLKAVASVTLFAFTFTSILPAGYAQQSAPAVEKEHLRAGQEAETQAAGLEDTLRASVPGTGVSSGMTRRDFNKAAAGVAASLFGITLTPEAAVSQELPERVQRELRQFLAARRITGTKPVMPSNLPRVPPGFQGFDFNDLYTEYEPAGGRARPLTQFGRVWPYGNALVLQALTALYRSELAAGRKEAAQQARAEALRLMNALVRLGRAEEALGFEGGYHFSYNTTGDNFIHPVAPTGNTLWVVAAVSYAMRELGDNTHLEWVNGLMERLVTRLQVSDPKDLRDGLFQGGLYTFDNTGTPRLNPRTKRAFEVDDPEYIDGMSYHVYRGDPNRVLEDIATEHQFDAMFAIAELIKTNEAAREGARGRLTGNRLDRMVRSYRRLVENVNKLWVTDEKNGNHFITGMEKVGDEWRLNRSVAVDNNSWAIAIFRHNEEMAWEALQYDERHFIIREGEQRGQRIGDMQDLPAATRARMLLEVGDQNRINPDERVLGTYFFDRNFMDRFIRALVPAGDPGRALWPRMRHQEGTGGFRKSLLKYAAATQNAQRRKHAQDLAQRLMRGTQRVQELYGGKLPNTTGSRNNRESNDPPPLFSTLNAITPAATELIDERDFMGPMPSELPKALQGIRIMPRARAGAEENRYQVPNRQSVPGTDSGTAPAAGFWAARQAGAQSGSEEVLMTRRDLLKAAAAGTATAVALSTVATKKTAAQELLQPGAVVPEVDFPLATGQIEADNTFVLNYANGGTWLPKARKLMEHRGMLAKRSWGRTARERWGKWFDQLGELTAEVTGWNEPPPPIQEVHTDRWNPARMGTGGADDKTKLRSYVVWAPWVTDKRWWPVLFRGMRKAAGFGPGRTSNKIHSKIYLDPYGVISPFRPWDVRGLAEFIDEARKQGVGVVLTLGDPSQAVFPTSALYLLRALVSTLVATRAWDPNSEEIAPFEVAFDIEPRDLDEYWEFKREIAELEKGNDADALARKKAEFDLQHTVWWNNIFWIATEVQDKLFHGFQPRSNPDRPGVGVSYFVPPDFFDLAERMKIKVPPGVHLNVMAYSNSVEGVVNYAQEARDAFIRDRRPGRPDDQRRFHPGSSSGPPRRPAALQRRDLRHRRGHRPPPPAGEHPLARFQRPVHRPDRRPHP